MIALSQRDNKWNTVKLAPSNLTIGRFGCTLTSLCMLSDYYKCFVLPPQAVNHNVKFTKDGLVMWDQINFLNFRWEKRIREFDPVAIDISLKDPKKSVIIEVNHSHWLAGVKRNIFGRLIAKDPLFGDQCDVKARYSTITGSSHFIQK